MIASPKQIPIRFELTRSIALVAPATRVVIVAGWYDMELAQEGGYHLIPVVAIRSSVVDIYGASYIEGERGQLRESPCHQELIAEGWRYVEHCVVDTYLIQDGFFSDIGFGNIVEVGLACEGVNMAWQAVACHWAAEEDQHMLAALGVISNVMRMAKSNYEFYRANRGDDR